MTKENLKILSPNKKQAIAKVLSEYKLGLRKIGAILGVSKDTIARIIKREETDEVRQFETSVREWFEPHERITAAMAIARIKECLPRAKIRDALDVYQIMMDKKQDPTVAIQTNVNVEQKGGLDGNQLADAIISLVERIEALAKGGDQAGNGENRPPLVEPGD